MTAAGLAIAVPFAAVAVPVVAVGVPLKIVFARRAKNNFHTKMNDAIQQKEWKKVKQLIEKYKQGPYDQEYLRGITFPEKMKLRKTDLSEADLSYTSFQKTDLTKSDFRRTKLQGANFKDSRLKQCNFSSAKCVGASFANSDLRYADFYNADLRGTNFRNADLRSAMFWRDRTNLAGADLRGAKIDAKTLVDIYQNNPSVRLDWGQQVKIGLHQYKENVAKPEIKKYIEGKYKKITRRLGSQVYLSSPSAPRMDS